MIKSIPPKKRYSLMDLFIHLGISMKIDVKGTADHYSEVRKKLKTASWPAIFNQEMTLILFTEIYVR